jgi:hypothetical protein
MATGLRDLFFRISAKDETGAAFASVKKNLSGVDGAARTVRDRFKSFGRAAGAAGAAASVGSVAVLAGLRDSLRLYQVQEKAEVAVATAVKQTGAAAGFAADALYRQAGALQELTSIGDESILADVTAQLLTFGNVSGDVFKRAQLAALDLSATLGSNLRAQTIQLGKALNDPVKGLSALSEAGITFTETQRNIVKAMVEAGEVAKAQNYILDEIAKFYGGAGGGGGGNARRPHNVAVKRLGRSERAIRRGVRRAPSAAYRRAAQAGVDRSKPVAGGQAPGGRLRPGVRGGGAVARHGRAAGARDRAQSPRRSSPWRRSSLRRRRLSSPFIRSSSRRKTRRSPSPRACATMS